MSAVLGVAGLAILAMLFFAMYVTMRDDERTYRQVAPELESN